MVTRDNPFLDIDQPERDRMDTDFEYFDIDDRLVTQVLKTANPPHRHDFEEIMWIRSGTADHALDGNTAAVEARSLLIIPKGHVHRVVPSPGLKGAVVRFKDEFLPFPSFTVFNRFADSFHLPVPETDSHVIDALVALIKSESTTLDRYHRATIAYLLQALVSKIEELKLRTIENLVPALKEKQRLWEEFTTAVEEHFRSEHTVRFYSKHLGVSPRKLNEVVKLFLGKSVAEAIDERLMLEARRLILFSDMAIKEIAFDLGYEGHSYFTKVFKKIVGATPISLRARLSDIQPSST